MKGFDTEEALAMLRDASPEVRDMAEELLLCAENDGRGPHYGILVGAYQLTQEFTRNLTLAKAIVKKEMEE